MPRATYIFLFLFFSLLSQAASPCASNGYEELLDSIRQLNFAFLPEMSLTISSDVIDNAPEVDLDDCETYHWIIYEKGHAYQLSRQYQKGLTTFYELILKAKQSGHYEIVAESYLMIALIHEFLGQRQECGENLKNALQIINNQNVAQSYPRYCVRSSSHYRIIGNSEKAKKFAEEAVASASKIGDTANELDGYMLLGGFVKDPKKAVEYFDKASELFYKREGYVGAASQTMNASRVLIRNHKLAQAKSYLDKAQNYLNQSKEFNKDYYSTQSYLYYTKKEIFKKTGQLDSALIYAEKHADMIPKSLTQTNKEQIKATEAKYQVKIEKQRSEQIKNNAKNLELTLWIVGCFLALLGGLTFFLLRNRTKIKNQNAFISDQNKKLSFAKKESDFLLSEIHHRVKNNLQNIISLILFKSNSTKSDLEKMMLNDINSKVLSLSTIHENLYTSGELNKVDVLKYLDQFTSNFLLNGGNSNITFSNSSDFQSINIDTMTPIGIILSEITSKAVKFSQSQPTLIELSFKKQKENKIVFTVLDVHKSFLPELCLDENVLELTIIKNMVRQLRGDYTLCESDSKFDFTFEEKIISIV